MRAACVVRVLHAGTIHVHFLQATQSEKASFFIRPSSRICELIENKQRVCNLHLYVWVCLEQLLLLPLAQWVHMFHGVIACGTNHRNCCPTVSH